jgi:hypothetical protein
MKAKHVFPRTHDYHLCGITYGTSCLVGMFDFALLNMNDNWLMPAIHEWCFCVFCDGAV